MTQINQADLAEINELRTKLSTVVSEAGQFSLQIALLEGDIQELKTKLARHTDTFKALLDDEQVLVKRLSTQYGTGSINFETGEFTEEQ
jgi:predicted  nucleic acid-binding Zn-ribbon protein